MYIRVYVGLIDVQGGFKAGKGRVDQIFFIKQIGEKMHRRKNVECMWALWAWRRHLIGSIENHYGMH